MRTLNFKCDGQKLQKDGDFSGIIPGSKGYLQISVDFNSEWLKFVRVAEFIAPDDKVYPELLKNGSCEVPDAVTDGAFSVRIVGKKGKQKIITNSVRIRSEV